jgi:hypothetical protein
MSRIATGLPHTGVVYEQLGLLKKNLLTLHTDERKEQQPRFVLTGVLNNPEQEVLVTGGKTIDDAAFRMREQIRLRVSVK